MVREIREDNRQYGGVKEPKTTKRNYNYEMVNFGIRGLI